MGTKGKMVTEYRKQGRGVGREKPILFVRGEGAGGGLQEVDVIDFICIFRVIPLLTLRLTRQNEKKKEKKINLSVRMYVEQRFDISVFFFLFLFFSAF